MCVDVYPYVHSIYIYECWTAIEHPMSSICCLHCTVPTCMCTTYRGVVHVSVHRHSMDILVTVDAIHRVYRVFVIDSMDNHG